MEKNLLPEDISIDNIHTLSGDALHAIEEQKQNQAKLDAKREQEEERLRREREYKQEQARSGRAYKVRNIVIMLAVTTALIGGAFTILNVTNRKSQETPINPTQTEKAIINFDSKKEIVFSLAQMSSDAELRNKLLAEGVVSQGGVTYFKTDPVPQELVQTLSPSLPDILGRSITSVFFGGQQAGNFLIMQVDSYERGYAGLLEWENAMSRDITPLFGIPSSTTKPFEDKVIENKDTRILYDEKGQTIFLYGFYNENIVIFAKNEEVFKSIFNSLLRQNL